ncbi:MAG: LamG domain-containing protein [Pseudomonadota bacterium]
MYAAHGRTLVAGALFTVTGTFASPTADAAAIGGPASLASLTDGLIAWWPLDVDARDMSGNGHHGMINGALPTIGRVGRGAYTFNGQDTYIRVPDSPELRLAQTDYTLAYHVRLEGETPYLHGILTKRPATPPGTNGPAEQRGWTTSITSSSNWRPEMRSGALTHSVDSGGDPVVWTKREAVPPRNEWAHVAITYNVNAAQIDFWVNGERQAPLSFDFSFQNAYPSPSSISFADLYLGRDSARPAYFLHGSLDDVRIYGRVLSEDELRLLATPAPPALALFGAALTALVIAQRRVAT